MSRLIVKNLPKHMTQDRLRKHFSQKGEVTDVKLVKTKDGVFRRFGYIGFKTQKQAEAACEYFNRTFIDTSRIEVEIARPIGDNGIPRAWSKHTEGSSAHNRITELQKQKEQQRQQKQDENASQNNTKSELDAASKLNDKQRRFLEDLEADKNDPALREFLQTMQSRKSARGRTWANDDILAAHANDSEFVKKSVAADEELYEDLPATAADQEEATADQEKDSAADQDEILERSGAAFDKSVSDLDYIRSKMKKPEELNIHPSRLAALENSGAVDSNQTVSVQTARRWGDAAQNNAQASEQPATDSEKEAENPDHQNDDAENDPIQNAEPNAIPPAEIIADTGRLMICNLAFSCTPEDIETLLKPYGPLTEVHIPIDRDTKESRGYAFVLFMLPENALKAYLALDQCIFQGRILEIRPAREKPVSADEAPLPPGTKQSFKVKRERERKSNATSDFNWNSLFMNQDTVAEAMANKLGVRKSDILDPDADNMAVRLALAETSIITETKLYLEEEGVVVDAFMRRKERSNTIILVKNIPYATDEEDLVTLFGKFGTLGRVVLPPTRTVALVEFTERNEAKSAFRRLAYSKFKSLPLFLEWAPVGTFASAHDPVEEAKRREARRQATSGSAPDENVVVAGDDENRNQKDEEEEAVKGKSKIVAQSGESSATFDPSKRAEALKDLESRAGDDEDDPDGMPVATVFVKNLNFATDDDGLRLAFAGLPGLRSARVAKKPDPKTGGKLSMGFGFLEFGDKEAAMRCIKTMQGFKLDSHELTLKFSNAAAKTRSGSVSRNGKRSGDDDDEDDQAKSTKLVVRNVPFQATKKDIRQLFSSFGQVKSVRLPRKFDGTHRGFAFIDFLTKQEAKTAMKTLGATHLYGRHLVLEWAQDDESVEAMRSKTARTFVSDRSKRRKVEMEDDMDENEE